jgi:imidazole glycerol-phosphate synthase subunit HisH
MDIVIIDCGIENIGSVYKALNEVGDNVKVSTSVSDIEEADKIILPGIGYFSEAMRYLTKNNLDTVIKNEVLNNNKKILGICLGMQLFSLSSEEGNCEGLGLLNATTKKFIPNKIKVPHIGWNTITKTADSKLLKNIEQDELFYFNHSYYVTANRNDGETATTNYGINFCSVLEHKNIFGVQFHPEKSHNAGLKIIKNFIEL